jgi:hypothetical protein
MPKGPITKKYESLLMEVRKQVPVVDPGLYNPSWAICAAMIYKHYRKSTDIIREWSTQPVVSTGRILPGPKEWPKLEAVFKGPTISKFTESSTKAVPPDPDQIAKKTNDEKKPVITCIHYEPAPNNAFGKEYYSFSLITHVQDKDGNPWYDKVDEDWYYEVIDIIHPRPLPVLFSEFGASERLEPGFIGKWKFTWSLNETPPP